MRTLDSGQKAVIKRAILSMSKHNTLPAGWKQDVMKRFGITSEQVDECW